MKVRIAKIPQAKNGLDVLWGGGAKKISENPHDNGTIEFNGKSHADGGVGINYNGNTVEVEGGETAAINKDGDMNIFGNMYVPNSKLKFKTAAKRIAKEEEKSSKQLDTAINLVNEYSPYNKYTALSFNSGVAMQEGAQIKQRYLSSQKEDLAHLQNAMLDTAEEKNISPEKLSNTLRKYKWGGKIKKYKEGGEVENSPFTQYIADAAKKYGVNEQIIRNLINTESGWHSGNVTSSKGAEGIMQIMPGTAKELGLTPQQLISNNPEDVKAVIDAGVRYFKQGLDKNNGDYKLALAAYNGGQGAVETVKKGLGKQQITGDDLINYYEKQPANKNPNSYKNETLPYIKSIYGTQHDKDVFRNDVYGIKGEIAPPPPRDYQSIESIHSQKYADNPGAIQPIRQNYFDKQTNSFVSNKPDNTDYFRTSPNKKKPSLADSNKLGISDFLGEIPALLDRPDDVAHFSYQPELYQPYQVSFQDRLNSNLGTFKELEGQIKDNPAALSVLAGQKYNADNQVLAEQFRTNQGINNEITNKNISTINDAKLKNLQLEDTQYTRQEQAKSNTRSRRDQALASISNKFARNRAENMDIRLKENLFNYRPDAKGVMQNYNPDAVWSVNPSQGSGNQQVVGGRKTSHYDPQGQLTGYTVSEDEETKSKWGSKIEVAKKATSKWKI